ncbi:MAG: SipW-dependent-type signal peptide-containing protein [Halobacterium sp.]
MTDDFELSRRKVLAGLGTVGVASAGAGLGTSAYFSDQETFQNNELVAGELDVKVNWSEHYSDWSDDEDDGNGVTGGELDVRMDVEGVDPAEYTAFPQGLGDGDPLLYVYDDHVAQFMANTSVEAFPDADDDGVRDSTAEADPCVDDDLFANVPDDMDPRTSNRTRGEDTVGVVDGEEEVYPLLYLEDVKPGDFGEVTFSFHICDNPGYVWLNGLLRNASEGSLTEPEGDDVDEEEGVVELLDEIRTALWYDDCDNLVDGDEQVFFRGTLREALTALTNGDGIPLDGDGGNDFAELRDSETSGARGCFAARTTHCLGFSWWLPADHGNEIQADSVSFDVGFYTEQCRHNDGSGIETNRDLSTGVADWQVVDSPDGTTGPAQSISPPGAWDDVPAASWVDPYGSDGLATDPPGAYAYEVDFQVDDPAGSTLYVDHYGADNSVEFFLDGQSLGGSNGDNAFGSLAANPSVGPVENLSPDTYTLRAVVQNGNSASGNPTGLLVDARLD